MFSPTHKFILVAAAGAFVAIASYELYWPIKGGYLGDYLEMSTYGPLKYRSLVSQVESAMTAAQERDAFEAARERSHIHKITITDAHTNYVLLRDLPTLIADTNRTLFVRVEWLPTRPDGKAYQAHRRVIEKTNLYLLFVKK